MPPEFAAPRSRRALLAAAAGTAAAFAASAALPLTAGAVVPDPVLKDSDNPTTLTTSVTDLGADSTALFGNAIGTGYGYGVLGTSAGGGGVVGWSISPPGDGWDPAFTPADLAYTGVFGSSPEGDSDHIGTGVWGDSPETGVYGSGLFGVEGYGGVGVAGYALDAPGTEGIRAYSPSNSSLALRVIGKVNLSRSGRKAMSSGTRTKTVSLPGTTPTSKVFAVLATSESGRWVRAVVPTNGSFKIYLNTALTSSAVVSWVVFD